MRGTVAVLIAPLQVELREFEVADPEPQTVLLDIVRANVCGSE